MNNTMVTVRFVPENSLDWAQHQTRPGQAIWIDYGLSHVPRVGDFIQFADDWYDPECEVIRVTWHMGQRGIRYVEVKVRSHG